MKQTILVVDDEARLRQLARETLESGGFEVAECQDGTCALSRVRERAPSAVLLDVTMPGMDGFAALESIRSFSSVPVIVVTARGQDTDRLRGFELGADDYVVKPYLPAELLARVRAVLRRAQERFLRDQPVSKVGVGELEIDLQSAEVRLSGQQVRLSATEFKLLSLLASSPGRVLTPSQILGSVWGREYEDEVQLLRVAVGRLRAKIGDSATDPKFIITRQGIGYTFQSSRLTRS